MSIFIWQVRTLFSDDDYRQLQMALVLHPDSGAAIPSSGGLRKIRWVLEGRGKRGGVWIIYYWMVVQDRILMLFIYAKNEQDDLTPEQLKVLRRRNTHEERTFQRIGCQCQRRKCNSAR